MTVAPYTQGLDAFPTLPLGAVAAHCLCCRMKPPKHIRRGLCGTCYQRLWARKRERKTVRRCVPKGSLQIKQDGYVMVHAPGHPNAQASKRVLVHRMVMAEVLGRPLRAHEQPHHKNGNRADNRPENLELWVKSQPAGARVEDLVEHAIAILRDYAPEKLA